MHAKLEARTALRYVQCTRLYIYIYMYIYYVAMVTAGLYIAYTPHQYST